MGSSSSTTRQRRVTFNRDDDGRIINEYREAPYNRGGVGQPSARGPTNTNITTIERTFTDQDSFELGDPRTTRSRESTFSLGQHIKKRAEIDERRVDKIIEDHHQVITSPRRAASPDRVVVTKTTNIVDGSTSSDGRLDIPRPRTSLGERVSKPTMTEQLWTSGEGREDRSYFEPRDGWTPHNVDGRTRLELSTTPGRSSTLRTNNGVTVLSGEVLHAAHLTPGVDDDHRRRYRVVRTHHHHRDTAEHLPSVRHYRVRKSGGSSIASSTSSMFSGVTVSDPGSAHPHPRYSRHHYIDDRSPRRYHRDDDYDFDRDAVRHHHRLQREPPEVVTVTRHVRRSPRDGRIVYDERSGEDDDHDSGYRGSPKHVDEPPMYRRSPIARLSTPPERSYVTTRHVYE